MRRLFTTERIELVRRREERARRLQEVCKEKGFTSKKISYLIGCNPNSFHWIWNGTCNPGPELRDEMIKIIPEVEDIFPLEQVIEENGGRTKRNPAVLEKFKKFKKRVEALKHFKKLCDERGYTVTKLCSELNCSRNNIYRLFDGTYKPRGDVLAGFIKIIPEAEDLFSTDNKE